VPWRGSVCPVATASSFAARPIHTALAARARPPVPTTVHSQISDASIVRGK
jgi:hypothetical protein